MKFNAHRVLFLILAFLTFQSVGTAQTVIPDEMRLTTPGAPWNLIVEGRPLNIKSQGVKPDQKSAYFLMHPQPDGLNISLYIEPVDKCKTSDECRNYVLNQGNPAWGKFQDLAKPTIGAFSTFEFYRPEVRSMPLKMFDIYGQYVEGGYWVDLHLSKAEYKKADHIVFDSFMKSIKFVPKSDKPITATDKLFADSQAAVEKWLAGWDAGKCKESYLVLSPLSRKQVDEKLWVEYCVGGLKARGRVNDRKPIASSLIKSLPVQPDHSGATVRYQTIFENGPSVEVVTLVLEKNGIWTVANYLIQ